jgi:hypothetical protein
MHDARLRYTPLQRGHTKACETVYPILLSAAVVPDKKDKVLKKTTQSIICIIQTLCKRKENVQNNQDGERKNRFPNATGMSSY